MDSIRIDVGPDQLDGWHQVTCRVYGPSSRINPSGLLYSAGWRGKSQDDYGAALINALGEATWIVGKWLAGDSDVVEPSA